MSWAGLGNFRQPSAALIRTWQIQHGSCLVESCRVVPWGSLTGMQLGRAKTYCHNGLAHAG